MTADIRAAAEAAVSRHAPGGGLVAEFGVTKQIAFVRGAVWAQAHLTPTREQIAMKICAMKFPNEECLGGIDCEESIGSHSLEIAEAVLALLQAQAGRDGT